MRKSNWITVIAATLFAFIVFSMLYDSSNKAQAIQAHYEAQLQSLETVRNNELNNVKKLVDTYSDSLEALISKKNETIAELERQTEWMREKIEKDNLKIQNYANDIDNDSLDVVIMRLFAD